ncbi:DUF5686 and carboxypeptidase-like regulatory domain-containing protein [Dysgonomonas sp. 511]|uniref:DUF5686 and carboxypeptidase-like regulatory domain-containing protein n=1 Tax=Dysgonomonas sp. 511 TaxID=2302930 RepID=UPI0021023DAE|nr:DUF5686 and carboxypeptidase-like regulatory domain-containing protein [Dysgonomonas sp. 511]
MVKGVVKDSITGEKLPFVTISFDKTTIGTFSDEDGEFRISNHSGHTSLSISILGYKTKTIKVLPRTTSTKEILLVPEDRALQEVVVKPKKEKYSKKNNPAVELIKKVIANKNNTNIASQSYYEYNEYERTLFAFNDFKPEKGILKRYKFLPEYMDTSRIDGKTILPFSLRERLSDVFYRKEPKSNKRIVKAYQIQGLDQEFETEGIDAVIKEVFKDVSIFDNSITLLLHEFVSPLSSSSAINFYRWYLSDTVSIDNDRYVKLDFAPFNSRDIGFTGHLFISLDSTYAVKRAIMSTPKKMNINFVDQLVIQHDFEKNKDDIWIPVKETMALDLSMLDALKFYVEKTKLYENTKLNNPMDPVFILTAPEVCQKDYDKRNDTYWIANRPLGYQKDFRMDDMMKELGKDLFLKVAFGAGKLLATGYIPTSKDENKNKVDIGTIPTFYSYNSLEGNRFRFTMATTKNLHPHLFLYGYGAYGTRDNKFKYYAEATWAFNDIQNNKEEFPKQNLTVAYKYDINTLGQRYTQAERDNILMSLSSTKNQRLTYNRQTQVAYEKEFYNGFSFKFTGQTFEEDPAGNLVFNKMDADGNIFHVGRIKTTEAMLALRYAPNEKFFQQRRKRSSITSKKFVLNLSHTMAFDGFLGGQYHYNKTSFSVIKSFWFAPYGKLTLKGQAEKIWGETPFPFLITPSANNSYTIQNGNFYLIEPLEFVHDSQVSWEAYYHLGGFVFNRIPLLKYLKWREILGFRGFLGSLSDRNNPQNNHDLLLFPQNTHTTKNGNPYMEFNVGIENIFKFFRIDYVRRINYLDHPGIDKDGFRISFDFTF